MLFYHFTPDALKILNKDLLNHIIFDIFITFKYISDILSDICHSTKL